MDNTWIIVVFELLFYTLARLLIYCVELGTPLYCVSCTLLLDFVLCVHVFFFTTCLLHGFEPRLVPQESPPPTALFSFFFHLPVCFLSFPLHKSKHFISWFSLLHTRYICTLRKQGFHAPFSCYVYCTPVLSTDPQPMNFLLSIECIHTSVPLFLYTHIDRKSNRGIKCFFSQSIF